MFQCCLAGGGDGHPKNMFRKLTCLEHAQILGCYMKSYACPEKLTYAG